MRNCIINRLSIHGLLCAFLMFTLLTFVSGLSPIALGGAKLTTGKVVKKKRIALLIAAQEGHPDMQGKGEPFPPLLYPTRDVVLLYMALKDPSAGHFDQVSVIASRRQLDALRQQETLRMKPAQNMEERQDSLQVLDGIAAILSDPDTPPDTKRDWNSELHSTVLSNEFVSKAQKQRLSQCPNPEGHYSQLDRFPCALDIQEAIREFTQDVTEQDEGLIYFSGHGFRISPFKQGILNVKDRMLVAADSYIDRKVKGEPAFNTLSVGSMLETLLADDCRQILVILAACASPLNPDGKPGEKPESYLPLAVKKYNTKYSGSRQVRLEQAQRSMIILGAAQEEAFESTTAPILGDVFTFYLRTAIEDRISRISDSTSSKTIDYDGDGAFSVEEAFEFAEAMTTRQGQVPYIITWQDRNQVYPLRGSTQSKVRPRMVYAANNIPLSSKRSKGTKGSDSDTGTSLKLLKDGVPIERSAKLDARLHTYELVNDSDEVEYRTRYAAAAGEQLRWEKLFLQAKHEIAIAATSGLMLGPNAYPDGTHVLWENLGIDLSRHQTYAFLEGIRSRLEIGGELALASSRPQLAGNLLTANYEIGIGAGLRLRHRLSLLNQPTLGLGLYPGISYMSLFEYRKTMLNANLQGVIALGFPLRHQQRLELGLKVRGIYADLDCQTENETQTDTTSFEELLAHRCNVSTNPDGTLSYAARPGMYFSPRLYLSWNLAF